MIEKLIVLEDIDPVIFYGVNNANIQLIKALYSAQYFSSLVIFSSKAHISSSSPSTLMTLPRATMRSFGYKALINCILALFTP